jgi:hypothetical protein
VAYVRRRYQIAAIDVLLAFNFAVVFILIYCIYLFPPSKPILIGDVLMNMQNAAARHIFLFLFCNPYCLLTHQIILR